MITKIGIFILILIAGSTLYFLDFLNKQDLEETAKQMHQTVQQVRAEAKARQETKVRFESQTLSSFTDCEATAIKTYYDYVNLIQKAVPIKRGQAIIPDEILVEAAKLVESAKSDCKKAYEKRLQEGP
jgi:hypothetical protein